MISGVRELYPGYWQIWAMEGLSQLIVFRKGDESDAKFFVGELERRLQRATAATSVLKNRPKGTVS